MKQILRPALLASVALSAALASCGSGETAAPASLANVGSLPEAAPAAAPESPPVRALTSCRDLLPAEPVVYAEVESLDELEKALGGIAIQFHSALPVKASDYLAMMLSLSGGVDLIDSSRPVGFAVHFGSTGAPRTTVLVPVSDATEFERAAGSSPEVARSAALGDYVALSQDPDYAPAGPAALAEGLPQGIVSVRVDLETLVRSFRPMIEMGLEQMESQQASGAGLAQPGARVAVEWMREMLDSARTLDVSWRMRGSKLDLAGSFTARSGSMLAQMTGGEPCDLSSVLPFVDESEPMAFVGAMDFEHAMKSFGPFFESMVLAYPEPLREEARRQVDSFAGLAPLLGGAFAGSGGFGRDGMRFAYRFATPDPEKALAEQRRIMESGGFCPTGFRPTGGEDFRVEGTPVFRRSYELDPEFFEQALGGAAMSPEERAAAEAAITAMYGSGGLEMSVAATDEHLLLFLGGDGSYIERVLRQEKASSRGRSQELAGAVESVDGSEAAFVLKMDLARFFVQVQNMVMGSLGTGSPNAVPADSSVPLLVSGSIDGPVWAGSLSLDVADLASFVQAMARF